MHEVDLIPASYRRQRLVIRSLQGIGALLITLAVMTVGGRVWLDTATGRVDAKVAELQAQQTITSQERAELESLGQQRQSYQEQLYLLKGLRSGAATTELFGIIDQALIGEELWFRSWDFRRAGVTNDEGQPVETGYFVVVDGVEQAEAWRIETHMTILGQATDHAALSRFVQRLLNHPEIESVHIRRSELQRFATRNLVDFDLAVVINRRAEA